MKIIEVLANHRIYGRTDVTPPSPVTDLTITNMSDKGITLSWKQPYDADYAGVRVLMKKDAMPTSNIDGDIIFEGSGTTVTVPATSLVKDGTYYFRVFTYDTGGNINSTTNGQTISQQYKTAKIYGFAVDETNSDPYNAVTYIEDAVGMTPATNPSMGNFNGGSWLEAYPFNKIRPVAMDEDANILTGLDPNVFSHDDKGNVFTDNNYIMIEIPPVYWKFTKTTNGYEVRWSDEKVDEGYQALAHERGGVLKGNLYVGAYEGYYASTSSPLYSRPGRAPSTNTSLATYRNRATDDSNASGYGLVNFHTLTLIQILFVSMFKTLNSDALGKGRVNNSDILMSGDLDNYGMYYGNPTGYATVKFMGIENLWGNTSCFIDGLITNTKNLVSDNTKFNQNGSGYAYSFPCLPSTDVVSGFTSSVVGKQIGAFFPQGFNGSATTHYCDYGYPATSGTANYMYKHGGHYFQGDNGGLFFLELNPVNDYNSYTNCRLQYLAP